MGKKYRLENLFDLENANKNISSFDISGCRVKTIKAGDNLECEIYPIWKRGSNSNVVAKTIQSRPAQEALNHKNLRKHIVRLTNANFTKGDLWATFGYDDEHLPETQDQAYRDITNFIRRLNRLRKKEGKKPLKYIYVTEHFDKDGKPVRPHHHMILSGDMERDVIESMWTCGGRNNTRRLSPDRFGLEGLARYITKAKPEHRRWGCSLGLKKPEITYSDNKISKRRALKIAENENEAKEIFEKIYKGYIYNDIEIKYSSFVSGAYIYVRMRRDGKNDNPRIRAVPGFESRNKRFSPANY